MKRQQRRRFIASALALLLAGLPALSKASELEINTATQAQLESLPGIGPALAERLLAARAQALFEDWPDLHRRVSGFGPKLARGLSNQGLRVRGLALP